MAKRSSLLVRDWKENVTEGVMEQAGAWLLHSGGIPVPFEAFSSHQHLSVVVDKTWIWERSSIGGNFWLCPSWLENGAKPQRELRGCEVVFWVLEDGRRIRRWALDVKRSYTSQWDLHVGGETFQCVSVCLSCRERNYQEWQWQRMKHSNGRFKLLTTF